MKSLENGYPNWIKIIKKNKLSYVVEDIEYGTYNVRISTTAISFPLHPKRKAAIRLEMLKQSLIGTFIRKIKIIDVFEGKTKGYVNRGTYISYILSCGHEGINTLQGLKNTKYDSCQECRKGPRSQDIKRSATYNFWVANKKKLPLEFKEDYSLFLKTLGEKPFSKAKITLLNGQWVWDQVDFAERDPSTDLTLIMNHLRRIFRQSSYFKKAIDEARVETEEGIRYQCAACGELFSRKHIQVDHIESIIPLDGRLLHRNELIDRIWTSNIQILDIACHKEKTKVDNAARKAAKKEAKDV